MHSNLANVASLLGEPSRANMLTALLDGRFHTAGELAHAASITPQTASFHLARLTEHGWIRTEKHGRYRYYRLADSETAQRLEQFLAICPLPEVRSFTQSRQMDRLRYGRTCYDHLAGQVGVTLTEALVESGYLLAQDGAFEMSVAGADFFTALGLDLPQLRRKRRTFAHACLDWSERKHHVGGALGHGLLHLCLERAWIERMPGMRAIAVTADGQHALQKHFGVQFAIK
ncbi:winged helix-turn-helix domain-containing protein [Paenibacillus campi]|uniref:ArsR/SmtB family transcription factor n=1 Tax=Paenibacillus campi TaxID=3106031 RepID=UPI002AFE193C|nr:MULTISPECIES: winged helix-turn-helix domain-containing protein [unclassified Paenibacillus]